MMDTGRILIANLSKGRLGEDKSNLLEPVLTREYLEQYAASAFTGLGNFEVCVRLLERGRHAELFLVRTLPPTQRRQGRREDPIRRSRERYATSRSVVEARIER